MNQLRMPITLIFVAMALFLGTTTVQAVFGQMLEENNHEEEAIKNVVDDYFAMRYRFRAANQVLNINNFADDSLEGRAFKNSEAEKLEIEIANSIQNHLGYRNYTYTLDYDSISVDLGASSATVMLTEGYDVVFEISEIAVKDEPIVSKLRGLKHTIRLRKTSDGWRIQSDKYDDFLWRFLKKTKRSKDEILSMVKQPVELTPSTWRCRSIWTKNQRSCCCCGSKTRPAG